MNNIKRFKYRVNCYCNHCGNFMRVVTLETNYELDEDAPDVMSKKVCKVCRTGEYE